MNDPMPVFVLKAKDRLALEAIWAYRHLCEDHGLDEQAREVGLAIGEIERWQAQNPELLQMPDHPHIPAS